MSGLKKKTTAIALAIMSSTVMAGTMGPVCTAGNVTVPCPSTGWGFGVKALYLKPSYSNDFAWSGGVNASSATTISGAGEIIQTDTFSSVANSPAWNWGFELEASYFFNTGNDLNLNWYHLVSTTTTHTSRDTSTENIFFGDNDTNVGTLNNKPSWDAVNLEFGQHVDFSERKKIRFHGGVQYARIKSQSNRFDLNSDTLSFDGDDFVINYTNQSTNSMLYNGFGPRVGADMSYQLGNGFNMFANGAVTLLVGSTKYSTHFTSTDDFDGFEFDQYIATGHGSKTKIVPELEGKLGIEYGHNTNYGNLAVNAGWMWINYFGPLTSGGVDSDFGVQGPFVSLKWKGNIA